MQRGLLSRLLWRAIPSRVLPYADLAARSWIRYAPTQLGKRWLWEWCFGRYCDFECRTRFNTRMTGNTQDFIQRYLYFFGVWEPDITAWVRSALKPGDYFVDVGANIGYYTVLAARLVRPNGKVIAIEAAEWIHDVLKKHIALN